VTAIDRGLLLAAAAGALAQHLPLMFVLVAGPAALRQAGTPLWLLGLFAVAFLPLVLQFLWAPRLEARCARSGAGWRGWAAGIGLAMAATTGLMALVPPGADVAAALSLLVLLMLLGGLAASQKIAIGGLLLAGVPAALRGQANAALGAGAALGSLGGAAGLTILLGAAGWTAVLLLAAAAMLGLAAVVGGAPPVGAQAAPGATGLRSLVWRRGTLRLVGALLLVGLPIGLAYGMVQPRLVDVGFGLREVGLVNGIGQVAAWLLVAPLAARAVGRVGPARSLAAGLAASCPLLGAIAALTFALGEAAPAPAIAAAFAGLLMLVGLSVAVSTLLMRIAEVSQPAQPASGLSLAQSLYGLAIIVGSALAGPSAHLAGYAGLGAMAAAAALLAILGARQLAAMAVPDA
jgi:PAT family beta-lactamase induction signal transducer AmpG